MKVREGRVRVKAVYLAIGITMDGEKEVLGLWLAQSEGAKFWLQVVTELKNRGVQDILIACVDGLKGFPEAIEAVYPHAAVQLCIVYSRTCKIHAAPLIASALGLSSSPTVYLRDRVAINQQSIERKKATAMPRRTIARINQRRL